jgi:predicted Zn-dependent peptidase
MNKLDTIKLDNGMTIYLYKDSRRHSTLFQFITLFGGQTKDFSVDGCEYHMQDGIAHILEHYVVECNDSGNFLELLGEAQMNTNAATYYDMTNFYFDAVEDVKYGIQTMLNGLYNIEFSEEKLEKLKNPIYQEVRGKSDSKFYNSNIKVLDNIFNNIKFRSIGGTLEEIKNTTIDDLKLCYEAFYVPSNQYIVVAGNFDKEEIITIIKDFYKNIKIKKHDVKLLSNNETVKVKCLEDTLVFPTPLDYIDISFKIDISNMSPQERLDLDFYIGRFYNNFFGVTSPLYKELVDNKIITSGINCSDKKIDKFLIISIGAYTHDKDYFKEKILTAIKKLNYFNEELFELDKKVSVLRMILRDENIINMIMPFVDNLVHFNYPYLDTVSDIERLNYKDYVKMISNLDFSNYTIINIVENEKKS